MSYKAQTIGKNGFINWRTKRPCKEKTVWYCEKFITLDTETSHCEIEGKKYTWITSIQVLYGDEYYLFRKPSELINFYLKVYEELQLDSYHRLVTIIHNASYDLAYLLPYFQRYLPFPDDRSGIYDGTHKIKQYRQGPLEFRDTYILSGVSLEKWCKDMNTVHQKKVGLYDYKKILYQDSELNEDELEYDKFDVLALKECYEAQMKLYDDDIATVPNTGTGYIRRECRAATRDKKGLYRKTYFNPSMLTLEQFKMCLNSYAGGFTHNNRFLKGMCIYCNKKYYTIYGNFVIGHRDFRSHYPSQMRVAPLPFGPVHLYYDHVFEPNKILSIKEVLDLYPTYSSISTIWIKSAKLRDHNITMPFMQRSKMMVHELPSMDKKKKYDINKIALDNGRIITFNGNATMDVDNHTLQILNEQYELQYQIIKVITFVNTEMPKCLRDVIDKYFKQKDDFKRIVKKYEKEFGEKDSRTIEAKVNLQKAKAMLNSIYGMFATNPINDDIDIDFGKARIEEVFVEHKIITDEEMDEKLNAYYNSRNSFLPYQVGVFITALARKELYQYIKTIGYDKVLYCDTDSIFYIKTDEVENRIMKLNNEKQAYAEKIGAYIINSDNEKIYYDWFDDEPDIFIFLGLHSKCYGYIYRYFNKKRQKNVWEFCATIAGVPSRKLIDIKDNEELVYKTREKELGNIKNIKDGFIFKECTGTTCTYDIHYPEIIEIDGHSIETAGGAIIEVLPTKEIRDIDDTDWTADTVYDDTLF